MATKAEQDHTVATSPQDNLAFKATIGDKVITVDGPAAKVDSSSSESVISSSDLDNSSDSDKPTLGSPFHSPKPVTEGGLSDTTLEDGEIPENMLESTHDVKGDCAFEEHKIAEIEDKVAVHAKVEDNSGTCRLCL